MPKSELEAIRQLKENSEINIKKADKGTTTVIMNKIDKIKAVSYTHLTLPTNREV